MAKKSRGWSGSSRHTETRGDGSHLGGREGSEMGPRIGPGPMASRVQPEYDRDKEARQSGAGRGMKRYTEE